MCLICILCDKKIERNNCLCVAIVATGYVWNPNEEVLCQIGTVNGHIF